MMVVGLVWLWSRGVYGSPLTISWLMTSSDAFDDGGVRGAGGLADGLQAEPLAGAFEFAEQVGEHPGSGRAPRVAEGDGAAVDVQLVVRADRKSVVSGKSVYVRVDFGGCRIIKKKNTK